MKYKNLKDPKYRIGDEIMHEEDPASGICVITIDRIVFNVDLEEWTYNGFVHENRIIRKLKIRKKL